MSSWNPKQHAAWSHWALTRSTTGGRNSKRENHINSFFLSEWRGRAPKVSDCQSPKQTFTEVEICPGTRTDVFISSPAREVTLADTHLSSHTHARTHACTHTQHSHGLDRQTQDIAHLSVQSTCWAPLWAEKTICGDWEWNTWPHLGQHAHAPSDQLSSLTLWAQTSDGLELFTRHPITSACKQTLSLCYLCYIQSSKPAM